MEQFAQKTTGQRQSEPVFPVQPITARTVLPNLSAVRRPNDANLQQYKDLIFQQTYSVAWATSRLLGVIR